VFGSSAAGLTLIQRKLVSKLSRALELPNAEESVNDFQGSVRKIIDNYKHRIAIRYSATGIAAAFLSSLCCLGPYTLLLLGLASTSAALSLQQTLYTTYHMFLVLIGLALVGSVILMQLRRDNQCTLKGLRKNIGYILVPMATMLVSYAVLNYIIGMFFLGGAMSSMLFP
jgi:hypothetical protein